MSKQRSQKTPKANSSPTGRPRKPVGQVRTSALRIRLTEDEREELDKAADALEVSTWARAVLLKEARRLAEESQ